MSSMIAAQLLAAQVLAADEQPMVSPGVIGFGATAVIAVVVVLLLVDLARRVRRVNQRAMIREQLEAEYAARDAADGDPVEGAPGPDSPRGGAPGSAEGDQLPR